MAKLPEQNAPPASTTPCPTVKEVGMTVLHEPVKEDSIAADIVFVHGLGGHPERTWSTSKFPRAGDESELKKRQQDKKSKSDAPTACFWPWDLVRKDFETLRIMTYGYDSDPQKGYGMPTNEMTITQHGIQLLNAVVTKRLACQNRPLLFVGHSLGGIIVMGAMNESSKIASETEQTPRTELLGQVSGSCTGIFFFATPHRGSQLAQWADICVNVLKSFPLSPNVSGRILKQLKFNSEILSTVERDFNRVRKKKRLNVYSYYETVPMPHIRLFDGKVVPDISSRFNDSEVHEYWVNANHVGMCKFLSEADPAYEDFSFQLGLNLREIGTRTEAERLAQSDAKNAALQRKLDFDERNDRQRAIAHKLLDTTDATFEWIWESDFAAWLRQSIDSGHIFWISGKPASGKSSMMEFIAQSEKTKEHVECTSDEDWAVIRHFFDFRAKKGIANNLEGFLLSLAAQIVEEAADAAIDVSSLHELLHPTPRGLRSSSPISLHKLRQAVIKVLQTGGGNVLVLLDGLDEFGEDIHGLMGLIKQVASPRCRICLASRPENPLPALLKGVPSIEMQKHNFKAIKAYAHARLESVSEDLNFRKSWAQRVAKRADGVFLWACFAIDEIIEGKDCGLSLDSQLMTQRLKVVPQDLEGIYARKIELLRTEERLVASLVLLLITYCRRRPVNLHLLWQAIKNGPTGIEVSSQISTAIRTVQEMNQPGFINYLNRCTSCFLYLQQHKDKPRTTDVNETYDVEYIHRTVKTHYEESEWPRLYTQTTAHVIDHHLWLLVCVQTVRQEEKEGIKDQWQVLARRMRRSSSSSIVPKFAMLTSAVADLPGHASAYELESGLSSFDLLHGEVPDSITAFHKPGIEEQSSHTYGSVWFDDCNMFYCYFGYYSIGDASDASTLVELMLYEGALLFVKDYLAHKDSNDPVVPLTVVVPLGRNLFKHSGSKSKNRKRKRPKRSMDGRSVQEHAHAPTAHSGHALTDKELTRRAALRVLFSNVKEDTTFAIFKPGLPFSHYVDIAKLAVSVCQRVEEAGLSITRPAKLQFKPYPLLIQAFDEASQKAKSNATFVGPFWAIGVAMWTSVPYHTDRGQDIIDLIAERGHNINDSDGPYGTIWHSFITGVFTNWIEGIAAPEAFFTVPQRNGANPCHRGIFGNALEFLWKVLHSPRMIRDTRAHGWNDMDYSSRTAYSIPILKHLLELGVPNRVADPNGRIPSVQEMERLAEITPEDPTETQEKILSASFRRYYDGNFEGANVAETLLNVTDDESSEFHCHYDEEDWDYYRLEALLVEAVDVHAVDDGGGSLASKTLGLFPRLDGLETPAGKWLMLQELRDSKRRGVQADSLLASHASSTSRQRKTPQMVQPPVQHVRRDITDEDQQAGRAR